MSNHDLNSYLETGLKYLKATEQLIYVGLGEMSENAKSSSLKQLFSHHRDETAKQKTRLDQIFTKLNIKSDDQKEEEEKGNESILEKGVEALKHLVGSSDSLKSKIVGASFKNLLEEKKEEFKQQYAGKDVADLALAATSALIEQTEIALYSGAITIAEGLGQHEVVKLLQETLKEEQATSEKVAQFVKEEVKRLVALVAKS
jgi:ferritin-like metal-binding protein YciE